MKPSASLGSMPSNPTTTTLGNVGFLPRPSPAVEEEAEQEPQGPGKEGKPCQQDGQQQNQKRGNEGKPRARADVGLQGQRTG